MQMQTPIVEYQIKAIEYSHSSDDALDLKIFKIIFEATQQFVNFLTLCLQRPYTGQ